MRKVGMGAKGKQSADELVEALRAERKSLKDEVAALRAENESLKEEKAPKK